MRVRLETVLDCPVEGAWEAVQTSALLREVAAPLVRFRGVAGEPLPERWQDGATVRLRSYLAGVVPLGVRTLEFRAVDGAARRIQTHERDPLVRRWDHRIELLEDGPHRTRYRDTVEIDAGVLTPLVWAFAQWFYRHRQRRWRAVARRLAAPSSPGTNGGDT
jgi:hypothetical protein